ncbi:16896_t:CDS:1, partial [Dentiscutata heterogama]
MHKPESEYINRTFKTDEVSTDNNILTKLHEYNVVDCKMTIESFEKFL